MRRPTTNWMNDDPWVMGVLEPILLLLFIAAIGTLLGLLWPYALFSAASLDERLTLGHTANHPLNVRFGSLAHMLTSPRHVRSTPDSGHSSAH